MKKLIYLSMLLLLSICVYSYTTWDDEGLLDSQASPTAVGDWINSFYGDVTITYTPTDRYYNITHIVDNFVANNGQLELAMARTYNVRYVVFNTSFSTITTYDFFGTEGKEIQSMASADWDFDGIADLVVSATNSSFGTVYVLKNNNGTVTTLFRRNLTSTTNNKPIKCDSSNCYLADVRNRFYKIEIGTGTTTSILIGNVTSYTGVGVGYLKPYLTIDNCVPTSSGNEALVSFDTDADSLFDEVSVINLNTMTELGELYIPQNVYNPVFTQNHTNFQIYQPPTCGKIDGQDMIVVLGSAVGQLSANNCYSMLVVNTYYPNNLSKTPYTYNITQGLSYGSPLTNCHVNNFEAIQHTQAILPDQYGTNYDYLFLGYNSQSAVPTANPFIITLNSTLQQVSNISTLDVFNYGLMDAVDVDDDSTPELLTPLGRVYDVLTNGSLVYYFAWASPPTEPFTWISVQDDSSFADYLAVAQYRTTSNLYFKLYYDSFGVNDSSGNVTPPVNTSVIFNETFQTSAFLFGSDPDCSNGSYSNIGNSNNLSIDNLWYCHKNINGSVIVYSSDNTSRINTDAGVEYEANNLNGANPNWFTLSSFMSPNVDFGVNTSISFYCDMANLDNRSYAYFHIGDTFNTNHPTIALNDNGCNNASNLPFNATCCEMSDIMTFDCSNNQAHFNASVQQILNQCPMLGEGDFLNMEQIDFILWKNFTSSDRMFFDDVLIYELTYAGNQIPNIMSNTPSSASVNVNSPMFWQVVVADDDLGSQIYTGFDCDNNNVLEYPVALRGSSTVSFNCTYNSTGTKTSKAYATDVIHYTTVNDTLTNTVNVVDAGLPYGVNCSGFTAPSCLFSCYFNDDFNYNYSIICNGWLGTNRTPVNGELVVFDWENYEQLYLNKVSDPIDYFDYASFTFQFDVNISDDQPFNFNIYDKGINNIVTNIRFANGQVKVFDTTDPKETVIYEYALNDQFRITGDVNFNTGLINWVVENNTATTEVTDIGVTSAGYFSFYFLYPTQMDMFIDNFYVEKGIVQSLNLTETEGGNFTEKPTYLTTGNFCAINWTSRRFIEEECELRDYNLPEGMEQICLVRACISDSFTWVFYSAQTNIFKTVIIVFVILLVAPLLVALLRRR